MKVTTILLSAVFLLSAEAFAKDDFPVCMTDKANGALDPAFFSDFAKVSMKLGVCDISMDPRMKAVLYLQNLRDFSAGFPKLVSDEFANVVGDGDVSKIKTPRNFEKALLNATFKGMGQIDSGRFMLDLARELQPGYFKKLEGDAGPMITTTVQGQLAEVEEVSTQLTSNFELVHKRLTLMMEAINNPTGSSAKSLTKADNDYVRSVICRFMPEVPANVSQDREDYLAFCSSENGGGNFNKNRGTLFCGDVESISSKHKEKEYQSLRASLSRSLADNVVLSDSKKLKEFGTSARIEIEVTDFKGKGAKKTIALSYLSAGSMDQLCSILRGPEYDRYWRTDKEGKKTLSPIMPLVSLKLPMSVEWKKGSESKPEVESFHVGREGEIEFLRLNDKKTLKADSPAYEKFFLEKKSEAKFLPVRSLVGANCDG